MDKEKKKRITEIEKKVIVLDTFLKFYMGISFGLIGLFVIWYCTGQIDMYMLMDSVGSITITVMFVMFLTWTLLKKARLCLNEISKIRGEKPTFGRMETIPILPSKEEMKDMLKMLTSKRFWKYFLGR